RLLATNPTPRASLPTIWKIGLLCRARQGPRAASRLLLARRPVSECRQRIFDMLSWIEIRVRIDDAPVRRENVRGSVRIQGVSRQNRIIRLHDRLVGVGGDCELAAALAHGKLVER